MVTSILEGNIINKIAEVKAAKEVYPIAHMICTMERDTYKASVRCWLHMMLTWD